MSYNTRNSVERLGNGHPVRLLAAAVVLLGGLLAGTPALASADAEAVGVVRAYMKSLFIGDVGGMQQSMSSSMQAQRERTLSNSNYAQTLQRAYAEAAYTVVESNQVSAARANVVVRITLKSADTIHVNFQLDGESGVYQIISEN